MTSKRFGLFLPALFFAVFLAGLALFAGRGSSPVVHAQQDLLLERRLSQIEQRFFTLESRIGRLEQISNPINIQPPRQTGDDVQVLALRTQIDALRIRLAELECGLAQLDERTLAPAARDARRKTPGEPADPCRDNPNSPLRLRGLR